MVVQVSKGGTRETKESLGGRVWWLYAVVGGWEGLMVRVGSAMVGDGEI